MPWARVGSNLLLSGLSRAFARDGRRFANETFNTKVAREAQNRWLRDFYGDPEPGVIGCKQNRMALAKPKAIARLLAKFDVRLIRLSRRNVAKVAISYMRAELYAERKQAETGKPTWGLRPDESPLEPVALDPDRFLRHLAIAARAQDLLDSFRPDVPTIDLDYRDIAPAPEAAIERVCAWLGAPLAEPATIAFRKATAENLARDVPNLDVLRAALRQSSLAGLEPLLDSTEID